MANDPLRAYQFVLDAGSASARFTACSQLGVDVQAIKYREAGLNQVVRWLPGRVEYAEVTLMYGLTASDDLWNWLQSLVSGKVERRNVTITMVDYQADGRAVPALSWTLQDAWPCRWRGAMLDALSQEAAIESLTLVFEGLKRSPPQA